MSGFRDQKSKHWWAAIVCSLGFCLVGLVFVPGLIGRQPTPAPAVEPEPTGARGDSSQSPTGSSQRLDRDSQLPDQAATSLAAMSNTFDCMVSASETIAIGSPIIGLIDSIHVERSEYVEANQVLASLESSVEAAALRVAEERAATLVEIESTKVSLKLGNKRLARARDLHEGASLSLDLREQTETETRLAELGVEQAKTNHRLAALQLAQAQATLARRTIRSPVSGFVVERLMSAGEVVDEQTILTVAQIDPLRIDVILPTHLFGSVAVGDTFEIVPEAPLDQARIANATVVDRVLDGASGTFGVQLSLPNPDFDVPGGLRCQARLIRADSEHATADPQAGTSISRPAGTPSSVLARAGQR